MKNTDKITGIINNENWSPEYKMTIMLTGNKLGTSWLDAVELYKFAKLVAERMSEPLTDIQIENFEKAINLQQRESTGEFVKPFINNALIVTARHVIDISRSSVAYLINGDDMDVEKIKNGEYQWQLDEITKIIDYAAD